MEKKTKINEISCEELFKLCKEGKIKKEDFLKSGNIIEYETGLIIFLEDTLDFNRLMRISDQIFLRNNFDNKFFKQASNSYTITQGFRLDKQDFINKINLNSTKTYLHIYFIDKESFNDGNGILGFLLRFSDKKSIDDTNIDLDPNEKVYYVDEVNNRLVEQLNVDFSEIQRLFRANLANIIRNNSGSNNVTEYVTYDMDKVLRHNYLDDFLSFSLICVKSLPSNPPEFIGKINQLTFSVYIVDEIGANYYDYGTLHP